ncbi:MAG: hypothetical protein ACR2GN_06160 [Bacteroidia bacterium]
MKTLKTTIPTLSILFISFNAVSQELPVQVKETFNEMYPDAVVKSSTLKNNDKYEVKFLDSEMVHKAYFATDGTWLYKERLIAINDIAAPALEAFKGSRWSGWKIERTEEINSPEHQVLYVIKVRREDNVMFLHFLPDGTLQNASSRFVF